MVKIAFITPYQNELEVWKKEIGLSKYGQDCIVTKIQFMHDLIGREFDVVELGLHYEEVKLEVVNATYMRLKF